MVGITKGEKNVPLVTADKLAKGLDLTLAVLFTKLEQGSDDPESKRPSGPNFYSRHLRCSGLTAIADGMRCFSKG